MELAAAVEAIEYKLATTSDSFDAGITIKMDITDAWPSLTELSDAVNRKYPHISLDYDYQPNGKIQMLITNKR